VLLPAGAGTALAAELLVVTRDPRPATDRPHYLRFAQAIALVSIALTSGGCCPMIPDATACGHCACDTTQRSLSQPLLCDTIGRDPVCCPPIRHMPMIGPLSPPNLTVA
jgi:hypothetical protein